MRHKLAQVISKFFSIIIYNVTYADNVSLFIA